MERRIGFALAGAALALAGSLLCGPAAAIPPFSSPAPHRALPGEGPALGAEQALGVYVELVGRGSRLDPGATTDVWEHDHFAYTGTFNAPCGGEPGGGVHVWDVNAPSEPLLVGVIPSPAGSRSNDVKVADLNAGPILVHSNEPCAGGPGGFEIYDVADPTRPVHLASVRIDELQPLVRGVAMRGSSDDVGVHNLWLFRQGERDFVAAVAESVFDTLRIYEITDPKRPAMVAAWGAEELFDPGVGALTAAEDPAGERTMAAVMDLFFGGHGSSPNKFLHDVTVDARGTLAYLSNWDAGLVLLDIADPAAPRVVSVALDVEGGSLDGEVNSHSAWPNDDGTVVVEGEEDFSVREADRPPAGLSVGDAPGNAIPAVAIATSAGDRLEASPVGNRVAIGAAEVAVVAGPLLGQSFPAAEPAGSQPKLAEGTLEAEAVWLGRACGADPLENLAAFGPGDAAVVRRGGCDFAEKLARAARLGAAAVLIANDARDDTDWGGLRIWDLRDPLRPVLASVFHTTCSARPADESCHPLGTYSAHNIVVEGDLVFVSWYWEGLVVVDISDPYVPVEVARFRGAGAEFEAQNGGPQDLWGVFKEPGEERVFASDRNGGLYVLEDDGLGL